MHNWAIITVSGEPWEVSADVPKVNGVRITPTMGEALAVAKAEGAELAPPHVLDARWREADLKNRIHVQDLAHGQDDEVLQSERIDEDIAAFTAEHGRPPRIVGNVCKSWTRRRASDGIDELYGLFVPAINVVYRGGRYWGEGLPVYRSESDETDAYIVQRSRDSSHREHHDYYTGVILGRRLGIPQPADTIPCAREPWQDPGLSRGQRAVEWSRSEMADGVSERSNIHRINQYLDGCLRKGERLGLVARPSRVPNWCAASACFGDRESCLPDEQPFLPWVGSGFELEGWAEAHGVWVLGADVASGKYDPSPGDVVILKRGDPDNPADAWKRHVCRWICRDGAAYSAIGGNERDGWHVTQRALDAANLLGIITVPDTRDLSADYDLTADLERRANDLLRNGDDPMAIVQALIDATDATVVG